MKIMTVVGARPNFMKVAPIITAIEDHNKVVSRSSENVTGSEKIRHILVHTGQHYDHLMSDSFFTDLNLPKPDFFLGVGSASHAVQTADTMRKFEPILLQEAPDVLVVVGDVNSTVACALVASKTTFEGGRRPAIAHVEAGLRSFDRTMPEEINRVLTDHLSDELFVTEKSGLRNLKNEGIAAEKIHFVGNTMIDSLLAGIARAEQSNILDDLGLSHSPVSGGAPRVHPYALLTLHRPANVDERDTFVSILKGIEDLAADQVVLFPAHPRTQKRIQELGLDDYFQIGLQGKQPVARPARGVWMIQPLGYLDFLKVMKHAELVITDSGGIQEETTCLGVPCVTVRENTERPITVDVGTNVVAGLDPVRIRETIRMQLHHKNLGAIPEKWDGSSATRIVAVLCQRMEKQKSLRLNTGETVAANQ
jgi:UDP-N-acetylglucosamine 2-epimerase (non-hydrolysing)